MQNVLFQIDIFIQNHALIGIPACFIGGILASISPCILPLLPVTAGIIAAAAVQCKVKLKLLVTVFVCGVTTTYVSLGIIAACLGMMFGKFLTSKIVNIGMGVVLLFIGISFFHEMLHLRFFNVDYKPRGNMASMYVMGMISGLMMIPCALPILGTILSVLSYKQDILYSIFCLISFSLGYALILSLVGISGGILPMLSEKRKWFIIVKKGIGAIICSGGVFFLVKGINL